MLLVFLNQSPERARPTPPREGHVRTRPPSPRRSTGESRFLLPPRTHLSSDPGLPPGTTTPNALLRHDDDKCFITLNNLHCVTLVLVEMTMLPVASASDGYSHPPPLSRLLSPLSEPRLTAPSQVSHLQMSPLLHPLVGQHILTVSQFSKEQVLHKNVRIFKRTEAQKGPFTLNSTISALCFRSHTFLMSPTLCV